MAPLCHEVSATYRSGNGRGVEDTTHYVYNRLLSLNEVGGRPGYFGCSLEEFHHFNTKKRELWPDSYNATSTHDTKRGEDARARINVLSEMPDEWLKKLRTWIKMNRGKKKRLGGLAVPDRNDEYFYTRRLLAPGHFQMPSILNSLQELRAILSKRSGKPKSIPRG